MKLNFMDTDRGFIGLLCLLGTILVPVISFYKGFGIWSMMVFSIIFVVIAYYVSGMEDKV